MTNTRLDNLRLWLGNVVLGCIVALTSLLAVELVGHLSHYVTHKRTWLWNDVVATPSLISDTMHFTPYGGITYRPNSFMPLGTEYPGSILYTDAMGFIRTGNGSPILQNDYVVVLFRRIYG